MVLVTHCTPSIFVAIKTDLMRTKYISMLAIAALVFTACDDDDDDADNTPTPTLTIPSEYISADYANNVTAENTVITELSTLTGELNAAEANAQTNPVGPIAYPTTLESVTLPSYSDLVNDWLVELVNAANSPDGFQNPGLFNEPAADQEGGLLGSRLLDEHGLELEQMIQKGSFGAALYNHATSVIGSDMTADDVDKLIEVFGTDIAFDPNTASAAAQYAKRRSDNANGTGYLYDIRDNLITAKAAIEAGSAFNATRDEALNDYLLNWEKSNFATVIYYCNSTRSFLEEAATMDDGPEKDQVLGSAMHAYAEGVGFAHGFKGLSPKMITDAEIDSILEKLLAPVGSDPESYRYLNEQSPINDLQTIIDDIQTIYGFTDEEVTFFYENQ
jgi:hypothetical protein